LRIGSGQKVFHRHLEGFRDSERLVRPGNDISVFPRRKSPLGDLRLPVQPLEAGLLPFHLSFDHFPEELGIHSVILRHINARLNEKLLDRCVHLNYIMVYIMLMHTIYEKVQGIIERF